MITNLHLAGLIARLRKSTWPEMNFNQVSLSEAAAKAIESLIADVAGLRSCLSLSEQENTKARKIIIWCAERLPIEDRRTLVRKVREDILPDIAEDDREETLGLHKAIDRISEHIDCAMALKGHPPEIWYQQLDALANELRGYLPKKPLPLTLHEIRNWRD